MIENLDVYKSLTEIPTEVVMTPGGPVEYEFDTTISIGNVQAVDPPSSVEEAILASARVMVNYNNAMLVPLSGFPLIKAILYCGSRVPASVASVFTQLQRLEVEDNPNDE